MPRYTPLSLGGALISALAAAVATAQDPPVRTLSKLDVEYAEPFSCVSGVRELADGRVVVADVKEKTLQLIDLRRGTATKIGQEGQGPGEWSTPTALFALPGDTTLLLDPQNQRFLTIHPDGSVGKAFSVSIGSGPFAGLTRPSGVDGAGRLYYQASSTVLNDDGTRTSLDSVPIIRYDRRTTKVDTVVWLPVPKSNIQSTGSSANLNVRITGPNPFAPARTWAPAPDGRIVIVHPEPYQVEIVSPAGKRARGPVVQYTRRDITDADKAPPTSPDCSVSISLGGGGPAGAREGAVSSVRSMTTGDGGRGGPPRTDWPESMPPFAAARFGAARVARTGEVWVPRSRGVNDAPTYDVFDASGKLTSRVTMPKGTRILGFGNGTVYAFRMDEDDLVYLQRYRLDAAR